MVSFLSRLSTSQREDINKTNARFRRAPQNLL